VIVVDASVLAPAVADGGDDGARCRQRLRGEQLAAPDLLRIEVMSAIRRQLKAAMIDGKQATSAIDDLVDLPLVVYPTLPLLRRGWGLRDNVTAYDSVYVALAEALGCVLLTADSRLSRAPGIACAVEVL
jgi:predicted nucleic acid-binding protein